MTDSALTPAEKRFLVELNRLGVDFLVVGATAAVLQGATTATQDIDLWFRDLSDPRIGEAARAAGGFFVSASFGMRPPALGGGIGDRFDVVVHMHGLESFDEEASRALSITLEGIALRLLPIVRIIESKRATGRPRDLAQIPALEETLASILSEDADANH